MVERAERTAALVVQTTSCGPGFARCSSIGIPRKKMLSVLQERASRTGLRLSRGLQEILRGLGRNRLSQAPRFQSVGRHHSRTWSLRFRQEQEGSSHHHRVLHQRHSRHGRRQRTGRRQSRRIPCRRRGGRSSRSNSPIFTTTLLFPDRRHSASSIGRWRKPNFSACPRKRNSAARSLW